jgi:hypothetical protein
MDKKLAKVQKRLRKQTDDPDTKAERKRRNKEKHLKDEERRDAKVTHLGLHHCMATHTGHSSCPSTLI